MPEIVTLKAICEELKLDPREARERLRAAVTDGKANPELAKAHKPRTPWQWVKGSRSFSEARCVLTSRSLDLNREQRQNILSVGNQVATWLIQHAVEQGMLAKKRTPQRISLDI